MDKIVSSIQSKVNEKKEKPRRKDQSATFLRFFDVIEQNIQKYEKLLGLKQRKQI